MPADLPPVTFATAGCGRISLPLPQGELTDPGAWAWQGNDDPEPLALQPRALAHWPDSSIRWLELTGLVSAPGDVTLHPRPGAPPDGAAWAREEDGSIELGNSELTLRLQATGASPLAAILRHGAPITAQPALSLQALGDGIPGAHLADSHQLKLRCHGPARAEADATGWIVSDDTDQRLFRYRLRVSIIAGQRACSLRLSLSHETPGHPAWSIDQLALRTHWLTDTPSRHHLHHPSHTLLCRKRELVTERPVELRTGSDFARIHLADATIFGEEPWPDFMPNTQDHTEPFLGLALADGWVTAAPRDMQALYPKALSVGDHAITWQLQPPWAEPLRWLQGRARAFTLDLLFSPAGDPPTIPELRRRAAACQPVTGHLPAEAYARHACFGMDLLLGPEPEAPRRFSRYLRKLGTLPTILGMWELGDTIDTGYTHTYAGNHSTRRLTAPQRPYFRSGNHTPLAEWSGQLTHEPVWANNEYDAILALAREWMRDAPAGDLWQRLGWFARHAIEVDFVHYSDSPLLHHGTPAHSADHQRATAYPSHLWAEGLLAWYCLSGDDDALDIAVKQGDFILRAFAEEKRRDCLWGFNRELGWALLHLAALADLTNETRFADGMQMLAEALTSHPIDDALLRQMAGWPFGFASVTLGVHATWRLTADTTLADWLLTSARGVAHLVVHEGVEPVAPQMALLYFATAWHISGDIDDLRPGLHILEALLDSAAWHSPPLEAKPVAMLHRGLATWLGAAHRTHLLTTLDYRFYPH